MIKKILGFVFASSLLFASSELTPNHFAYGVEIDVDDKKAFASRVNLSEEIYLKAYSKNLDDIRIYDKNANLVPFSLVEKSSQKTSLKSLEMVVFQTGDNEEKIAREIEQNKIDINRYEYTYLIKLRENSNFVATLKSIKLEFEELNYNWEAKVDIDFKEGTNIKEKSVAKEFLVMQLKDENKQNSLKLDTVELKYYNLEKGESFYEKQGASNEFKWIIKIYSNSKLPKITKATGYFEEYGVQNDYKIFHMDPKQKSGNEFDFSLPSSQYINELSIYLDMGNTILPAEIFYRSDKNGEWIKIKDLILANLKNSDGENKIVFSKPLLIEELKIKPINTSFDNRIYVDAKRKELEVIFNSANNSPFILTYGSNIAKKASIPADIFLGQEYISYAYLGKKVVLAGEKAYTQKGIDESEKSLIPKWLIWVVLGFGVVFLVFLAYKLSKEIKKDI